jgi:hypothetical protein
LIAASCNKGPLQVFALKKNLPIFPLQPGEISVLITYRDGSVRKEEAGYGSSFLSQSGRFINAGGPVDHIEIKDGRGRVRKVYE